VPGYVRQLEHSIDFDGETVRVTMRPLAHADALELRNANEAGGAVAFMKLAAQKLPGYIVKLEGPHDAAGTQVPVEEVCATAYFSAVINSCVGRLTEAARPADPLASSGSLASSSPAAPSDPIPPPAKEG
jgi:hypothetical protein